MYAKLIRDIQSSIGNENLPFEMLVDLAAEDAEACEQLNERLSAIHAVLTKGHTQEAIELAECKPNALDQFCQLDFPDRNNWQEHLLANELEPPPQLSVEIARQIEAAYDTRVRLAPLMKHYRLLALANAPIAERLLCLKRLEKKDPANPLWPSAVETLEQERIREIQREFKLAESRGDAEALNQLNAEVQGDKTLNVPKRLASKITEGAESNRQIQARKQMKILAVQMNQALGEYDVESGRKLLTQWQSLDVDARLEPSDDLAQSAAEAIAWLEEAAREERESVGFESAVKSLEQAIDENYSLKELESKRYKAEKYERPIPDLLLHRADARQKELVLAAQRSSRLRMGLIGTSVVALLLGLTYFTTSYQSRTVLADAQQKLTTFLSAEEYQQGLLFLEGLSPAIKQDAELIRLSQELIEKKKADLERAKSFDAAIAKITIEGDLNASLDQAIDEAATYARSDTEKTKVEVLRKRLETDRLVRQRERDKNFLNELGPIRDRIKGAINSPDALAAISELKRELGALKQLIQQSNARIDGMFGISVASKRNGDNLVALALKGISNLQRSATAEDSVSTMGKNLIPIDGYSESLTNFASKFPEDQNSAQFRRSAKENTYWQKFLVWQAELRKLKRAKLSTLTSREAEQLGNGLEKISNEMKVDNFQKDVLRLIEDLRARQKFTKGKELANRLMNAFDRSDYAGIWVLRKKVDEKLYYLTTEPRLRGKVTEKIGVKYFALNATESRTDAKKGDSIELAPHCKLAGALKKMVPSSGSVDYERSLISLLKKATSADSKNCDPLVVCKFVDQILRFGEFSCSNLSDFSAGQREQLKGKEILQVDWKESPFTVSDAPRTTAREFLSQLAKDIPTAETVLTKRDDMYEDFSKMTRYADLKIAGMLIRSGAQWKVSVIDKIKDDEKLIVLAPTGDKDTRLEAIGLYRQGNVVQDKVSVFLQAGRPVYINQSK